MTKLRYALLRHECPPDYRDGPHWDLLLERAGVDDEARLATWSLLELPAAWSRSLRLQPTGTTADAIEATPLPDHRAFYLDYEGAVSADRGVVSRVAGGAMNWLRSSGGTIEVELLAPGPLRGTIRLTEGDPWRLTWRQS
ncbi:hypothetical protein MalM25_06320 [Planctomycetes bacterium MalM25]|nr:hypothetical protein MalM25_06320 [Planctomycetes bacterium MalM25]